MISEKELSKLDYLVQALVCNQTSSERIISLAYMDELIPPSDEFKNILNELKIIFQDDLNHSRLNVKAQSLIKSEDAVKMTIGHSIIGVLKFYK